MEFELLGYFKEFYVANKFIGTLKCIDPDTEDYSSKIGYINRIEFVTEKKIELNNKKTIKPNVLVTQIIYPINGKRKQN